VGQTCVKWENSQGWRPMVFGHQLLIEFLPTNQNAIFQSRGSERTSHHHCDQQHDIWCAKKSS